MRWRRGTPDKVRDELGDLLFQIVFHARIAEEAGQFTMDDVITAIHEKMVRRHPHVFGGDKLSTDKEVLVQLGGDQAEGKGPRGPEVDPRGRAEGTAFPAPRPPAAGARRPRRVSTGRT